MRQPTQVALVVRSSGSRITRSNCSERQSNRSRFVVVTTVHLLRQCTHAVNFTAARRLRRGPAAWQQKRMKKLTILCGGVSFLFVRVVTSSFRACSVARANCAVLLLHYVVRDGESPLVGLLQLWRCRYGVTSVFITICVFWHVLDFRLGQSSLTLLTSLPSCPSHRPPLMNTFINPKIDRKKDKNRINLKEQTKHSNWKILNFTKLGKCKLQRSWDADIWIQLLFVHMHVKCVNA